MPRRTILDRLSIYIPEAKRAKKLVERPIKLGEKRDRSVNCLVGQAILQYLKRRKCPHEWHTIH